MLVLLLNIALAGAVECPWGIADRVDVHADMTTIYVNDIPYGVRGREARTAFEDVLDACGGDSVPAFQKWRAQRRRINIASAITAVGSVIPIVNIVAVPVGGIWAIIEAAGVARTRDALVREIEDEAEARIEAEAGAAAKPTKRRR